MIISDNQSLPLAELIGVLREARFCMGPRCARCGGHKLHRWGHCAGRQRYRCLDCRRTFSDLTGTPAAYMKKVELLGAYSTCLAEGLSVRRAAARVGIHRSTAFRWRHALIGALHTRNPEKLAGWIELGSMQFVYSEKGRRGLDRAPRRRGVYIGRRSQSHLVSVLVACDRRGHVVTAFCNGRRPRVRELDRALAGRIEEAGPTLTGARGRFGAASAFARRIGGTFRDARLQSEHDGMPNHVRNMHAYVGRLRLWIARFRGVATKYLPNYLIWHSNVDRSRRQGVAAAVLRWPVDDAFG